MASKRFIFSKDELIDLHCTQKLTQPQIAKKFGCSLWTIQDAFRKFQIKGIHYHYPVTDVQHLSVSSELLEILEGELLGDGCLRSRSKRSAFFSYNTANLEYLEWLVGKLSTLGMSFGKIHPVVTHCGSINYHVDSVCYAELLDIRNRWYPNGVKTVPVGFQLTKIKALHWYIGDGTFAPPQKRALRNSMDCRIALYTNGFSKDCINILVKELNKIGLRPTTPRYFRNKTEYVICLYKRDDIKTWFHYLPDCPVKSYEHKWESL